jgi:flagellar basal-body rod protein FlgB
MPSIHLFGLASQHNNWLSTRQTLLAGNIANINTPRYKALDLQPFDAVLESTKLQLTVSEQGHMAPDPVTTAATADAEGEQGWEVYHSGSNVSAEQELIKASEINRAYTLNTNVVKAFHRMLLTSSKAGN